MPPDLVNNPNPNRPPSRKPLDTFIADINTRPIEMSYNQPPSDGMETLDDMLDYNYDPNAPANAEG
jgi:hypothetical protein